MISFKLDASFWSRFKFYAFGLILGCILVSVITKGKACQLPSTLKLQELAHQYIHFTDSCAIWMKKNNISSNDINYILKNGSINFGQSQVHKKPYAIYFIEGNSLYKNTSIQLIAVDYADTTLITNAQFRK